MAKPKLTKTVVEPWELSVIAPLLRAGLVAKDKAADVAIGLKAGQCLMTFNGQVV